MHKITSVPKLSCDVHRSSEQTRGTQVGQGGDHGVQWDAEVLETAVILEGELGPLEGSMKPLTLMASEDGDGEPENWQQKKRSCAGMGTESPPRVLLICELTPVYPGYVQLSRQECKCTYQCAWRKEFSFPYCKSLW